MLAKSACTDPSYAEPSAGLSHATLLLIGSLSTHVFKTRTATGSELFSLLTCFDTTTFTLLSTFTPSEIISSKIWETPLSWHVKCSLQVAVRVSKTRVSSLMKERCVTSRKTDAQETISAGGTRKSRQGPVSRKSRKLFGSEKPSVKLQPACSVKLVFSHDVKGRKSKITVKFRVLERFRFQDTKRIMSPEKFREFRETGPRLFSHWTTASINYFPWEVLYIKFFLTKSTSKGRW